MPADPKNDPKPGKNRNSGRPLFPKKSSPCFLPVFSLFSLCYLLLEKLSKSLIPLSDCPFVLNRLPVFLGKSPCFRKKQNSVLRDLRSGACMSRPIDGDVGPGIRSQLTRRRGPRIFSIHLTKRVALPELFYRISKRESRLGRRPHSSAPLEVHGRRPDGAALHRGRAGVDQEGDRL